MHQKTPMLMFQIITSKQVKMTMFAKLHIDPLVPQRRCYVLPSQKACAERKDNLISAIFFKLKPLSAIQCVKHHYSVIVFNMYPYAPTVSHI